MINFTFMKKTLSISLVLAFLIFSFTDCKEKETTKLSESTNKQVAKSKFARLYPDYNPQQIKETIHELILKDSLLLPFYTEDVYHPVWSHDTLDVARIKDFVSVLKESDKHGLSSEYFSASRIEAITDSIDAGLYNLDDLYKKMVDLELTSTLTAVKYIKGMKYGFVNPKKLYKKDYDISVLTADSAFYQEIYKGLKEDPISSIINSVPTDPIYLRLQKEYQNLKDNKEQGFKKITSTETYKLGDKNKHISEIARRLALTGEYIMEEGDSIGDDSSDMILDENLLEAINVFRKKNSYPEEKEVGKLTIDALNRPLDYYLEKLQANMERYRWKMTKAKHNKHIEVNVASAYLMATEQDSLPLIMKVCVGTATNKTPLLQSDISYLNLNPIWNIPTSIAQKEVAVLQKKDPTYIKRHNMKLYRNGKEVDITTINWKEVDPSKFSYTIRQSPGESNALGLIKFMFNNAFSVYLHDTPSKAAFGRKNRTVSHGCVRVEKPFDLAFFCMSTTSDDIYKDQLFYSIDKQPMSKAGKKLAQENKLKKLPDILNPKDKISLFIDYYTVYMYPDDDMLYYADDVYGYDSAILNALKPQHSKVKKEQKN